MSELELKKAEQLQHERFKSFAEFWPYYVAEHSRPGTRLLHLVGTTAATASLLYFIAARKWRLLPLALLPGYAAAWAGHFFVEKNKPATFQYPLWSLMGDYKMMAKMISGEMEEELEVARELYGKR